ISRCSKEHDACQEYTNSNRKMPTRLLRVDQDSMRLVSHAERVRFAALSYCWGTTEQYTTTTANLE
ncbi:hypothetical protein BU23DRAFT_442470, partial [Bimuria novae-zelandiae CBS 107.79]